MRTFIKVLFLLLVLSACEDSIYLDQSLVLTEDDDFKDWVDYRSAELGLYALQQELVEQLIVLGELRGDLLKLSSDADADLVEVQNFSVSSTNEYASATNFYKLISACNALIRTMEWNHPEVLEDNPSDSDYQRIYGEALCMRGWAYFNAARIYGDVPYIPEQLTNYEDVIDYVMNPETTFYIDSGRYMYDINGLDIIDLSDTVWYPVDTVYLDTVNYETYARRYVDIRTIVDSVTYDLTERAHYVGVDYGSKDDIDADEWGAIIWTEYSQAFLLGQMALTVGDISAALDYFEPILYNYDYIDVSDSYIRFGLDEAFAEDNWASIFESIDINEHIFTMWFGKDELQTHDLQRLFDNSGTNLYYLIPTSTAVHLWETEWIGQSPSPSELWDGTEVLSLTSTGDPGDFYRGYGVSYIYKNGDDIMTEDEVREMLSLKQEENDVDLDNLMQDVDTLVYKYTNDLYDNDAFVPIYRASAAHLYASEICTYLESYGDAGGLVVSAAKAPKFLDGTYNYNTSQLGVRGRVDLSEKEIDIDVVVLQDPFTNEITGTIDFEAEAEDSEYSVLELKRRYFEEVILAERGKELAFEGERFYDLMRIAERRDDPSFLADAIADAPGKYSSSSERESIRALLMDEDNWYIPFYIYTDE
jgi:hypothetical protein